MCAAAIRLRLGDEPETAPAARLALLGSAALASEELLAILLGGRAGSLGRARSLLETHGGLTGLGDAHPDELHCREAPAIVAAFELGRRWAAEWPRAAWQIRTAADLAERLVPAMGHLEREELRVILLNTKNVVTAVETVYHGNLAGSSVRVGEVYRSAVRRQAAAAVVVHNHPSGDPAPSGEDLRITGELAAAGRLLDIDLLDHLVIGHGRWVSLRALGAL
jgi:DNA repair protein RadC